ncbi:MAG: c-type cytochrome [Paracoccaceae bacterium]|nr:c-type cytochrome [Paracoccaceae bacterium]
MIRKTFLTLAVLAISAAAAPALAEGDVAAGEKTYKKKCKTCHMVGDGAKNRVGPVLNGIVEAPAGMVDGFKYSKALLAKKDEGLVWTEAELDAFLTKPKTYLKGTKMSFAGFKDAADRANVIAYLKSVE